MNKRLIIMLIIFFGLLGFECCFDKQVRNKWVKPAIEKTTVFIDKASNNPKKYSVRLTDKEIAFFISNIKDSKKYMEYGSGGSTYIALLNSNAQVVSVESDEGWLDYMREWKYIRDNEGKRLSFALVDIGKTGDWGFPVDVSGKKNYPDYSKKVYDSAKDYDVVFIDGRFRVACALQTILNTSKDTKILMHDFTIRPYYHDILKFLDIVDSADTMVLFKVKNNVNKKAVKQMYEKYKYDCR